METAKGTVEEMKLPVKIEIETQELEKTIEKMEVLGKKTQIVNEAIERMVELFEKAEELIKE